MKPDARSTDSSMAQTEPFGPVSLHVPTDVALQDATSQGFKVHTAVPPVQGDLSLEALGARLNDAVRPLVVLGLATPPEVAEDVLPHGVHFTAMEPPCPIKKIHRSVPCLAYVREQNENC